MTSPSIAKDSQAPPPMTIPITTESDMVSDQLFATLYDSDQYSDLVIRCQDRVWRAHKAVICVQAKVLAAAVNSPFKEGTTGIIDLSEDDPEIVEHMINLCIKDESISSTPQTPQRQQQRPWSWLLPSETPNQTASFTDLTPHYATPHSTITQSPALVQETTTSHTRKAPYPSRLLTHAAVYCIAEQYNIPRLKNHALCKYAALIVTAWKTPFFVPSIAVIYEGTPSLSSRMDDLRAVAVRTAAENLAYFPDRIEFLEVCTENGEIATDVLKASLNLRMLHVGGTKRYSCKVDSSHDLVYIPALSAFGVRRGESSRTSGTSMHGFGTNLGGRYKCVSCGTFVT